jgi:uncharacterized protein (TIGR03086 family)
MYGWREESENTELLERALGYALCSVRPVTRALLSRPTPCRGWDLWALLRHANDSLAALQEGAEAGCVEWPSAVEACGDPVSAFRLRASRLLAVCAAREAAPPGPGGSYGPGPAAPCRGGVVSVDGWPLAAAALMATGALEIAVHGWDIARATGLPRPMPPALATPLLRTARLMVPEPAARHPLFALPVAVPPQADSGDHLVAFLGRDPARW